MTFKLMRLDHVAITVRDLDAAIEWYTKTLGLEHRKMWDGEPQFLYAGESSIALFSVQGGGISLSREEKWRYFVVSHFAFATDRSNFEQAQESLRAQGIDFRFEDHGVCHSVYINDPDGHTVEIATYEILALAVEEIASFLPGVEIAGEVECGQYE